MGKNNFFNNSLNSYAKILSDTYYETKGILVIKKCTYFS